MSNTTIQDQIQEFIEELEELRSKSDQRSGDESKTDHERGRCEGARDAYTFVQIRLRTII